MLLRKSIAIDMDQVLADLLQSELDIFNKRYNKQITKQDLTGKVLEDDYPELANEIYEFMNTYEFFRDLPVIEHSQEVIKELQEHYDIYIATAAMFAPNSMIAKYEWLQEHFPFLHPHHFVFCGDKGAVHADYLIDDSLNQLESFQGQGIMFSAPHNEYENYEVKVTDWLAVRDYFMEKLTTKS